MTTTTDTADLAHITLRGGVVVEITAQEAEADLWADRCGLPGWGEDAHEVTPEEAVARMRELYESARHAYATGRVRAAESLLDRMARASGRYGLASGREFWRAEWAARNPDDGQ